MRKKLISVFSLFTMLTISAQQDILWEKTIGGENAEFLYNAIATPDYGFLIIGSSASNPSGNKTKQNQGGLDYFIWKMSEDGKQEWQNSFGGDGEDYLKTVTPTPEGGFLLVGSSNSSKSGDKTDENIGMQDIWIIKLNPIGQIEWQKTMGGLGSDEPVSVIRTSDNGYLIGAISDSPSSNFKQQNDFGANDFWIIKLDEKGDITWEKTIGGEQEETLKTIIETKNGYVIAGMSNSKSNKNKTQDSHYLNSVWLVELDKKGDIIHEKTLENSEQSNLISLTSDKEKQTLSVIYPNKNELRIFQLQEDLSLSQEIKKEFKTDLQINAVLPLENDYLITANNIGYKHKSSLNQNELESKYLALNLDNRLDEKWKKEIGKPDSFSYLEKVIMMRDGSFLLLGNSNNSSEAKGLNDFYIVKLGDKSATKIRDYIEAYPNPTRDFVNVLINKSFEKATIEIYNLTGQLLQTQTVKNHSTPINLVNYTSGVYILKINYDNQSESIKIIKK